MMFEKKGRVFVSIAFKRLIQKKMKPFLCENMKTQQSRPRKVMIFLTGTKMNEKGIYL